MWISLSLKRRFHLNVYSNYQDSYVYCKDRAHGLSLFLVPFRKSKKCVCHLLVGMVVYSKHNKGKLPSVIFRDMHK